MGILGVIKSLLQQTKIVDLEKLPSQGIFYPKDFEIKLKKVNLEDIIEYEVNFDNDNLFGAIEAIKKIVRKNLIFNNNYNFFDVKSVDIVYLFFELVSFTNKKPIRIPFFDDGSGKEILLDFTPENFNYFDFSNWENQIVENQISIEGYKFSWPTIGVENCLTQFLLDKSFKQDSQEWNNHNYDFIFFLGNKNNLTFEEIENLVTIFNYELENSELDKIKKIVQTFSGVVGYTLKKGSRLIDLKSKLDLKTIWR